MFVDLLGKTRIKIALHVKTGNGQTVNDVAREHLESGFDVIAITENWKYTPECEIDGIKVMSGCEYSVGGLMNGEEAYHIIGVGMTSDPEVPAAWQNMKKTARHKACEIVKMIQKRNGIAIIAYPSHNKNSADELLDLGEIDAIEIYNSETKYGESTDGLFESEADKLSAFGASPALVASNGVNCYEGEEHLCAMMVETFGMETNDILRAIRQRRFYSTEAPRMNIERIGADKIRVDCTPVEKIEFFSNMGQSSGKTVDGEDLVSADYMLKEGERFVRIRLTDKDGLRAWSNTVRFDDIYR